MDLLTAIEKRHSYRGTMQKQQPHRDDLITIVKSGIMAPSGKNAQTTQFIIIDDKEIIAKLNSMHPANLAMQEAPAMIACIIDQNPAKVFECYDFQLEDCAAAVENMLLTITALGYASVWIDGWLRLDNRQQQIAELLNLPAGKKVQIILPIGVPAEQWQQKERKPFEQRACFNTYNLSKEK